MTHINIAAGALNMSVWIVGGREKTLCLFGTKFVHLVINLAAIFQPLSLSACLCLSGD